MDLDPSWFVPIYGRVLLLLSSSFEEEEGGEVDDRIDGLCDDE